MTKVEAPSDNVFSWHSHSCTGMNCYALWSLEA